MLDAEIKGPGYRIWHEAPARTIHFEGILRLGTSEYEPIYNLLAAVLAEDPPVLHLRMTELTFLNSSGINTLYKFAIAARKQGKTELHVHASSAVPWQSKSLPNLTKFLPAIVITTA